MDKPKKRKRRTLVIIDSESLSPNNHYDLSFLESEKRLDIWLFFKNKIQHSFTLHKDYNAKSVILPRYEEDTLSYITKRVCYELGRRGEKYHKLYFIGDAHPLWEGLVQFFRERGYVAHHLWSGDYATVSPLPKETPESLATGPSHVSPSSSEEVSNTTPPSSHTRTSPSAPGKKAKPSPKPNNPLSSELYEKLRAYLTGELAGKTLSRKEFLKALHKIGISIREDARPRRYDALIRYLSAEGLVTCSPDLKEVVILTHEHAKS